MILFVVGAVFGAAVGIVLCALCVVAKDKDGGLKKVENRRQSNDSKRIL